MRSPQLPVAPLTAKLRLLAARIFLALCALQGASCVAVDQDLALAPLVTRIRTAGGGSEIEALAGAVKERHALAEGPLREWALMPFVKGTVAENGDTRQRFLVPLGTREVKAESFLFKLLPLWRYERTLDEQGRPKWTLVTLPLTYWSHDSTDRVACAVFPFGGVLEHFLSFDRVEFALFPLYLRTSRDGQVSTNFLWPFFNWTYGPRGSSYRIWPLFGRVRQEGRYDRKSVLWPIFQWGKNNESTGLPEKRWMIWPLYGHKSRGSYHAETFLWPFFGYSSNPDTGMWAWDGPWPLVRFVRPGSDNPKDPKRSRIWPFWSKYEGDGLTSEWVMFPLVNWRTAIDAQGVTHGSYAIPIWQRWNRAGTDGVHSSWTKLWPLFQDYQLGEHRRTAFPALIPLWHLPEIDEHYAWVFELVTRTVNGPCVSHRLWGNIYRREIDQDEDRAYLSFLWSRRAYVHDAQRRVEHSLLFGLLRWRSYPDRSAFSISPMLPAFPGPGWPMVVERAKAP